MKREILAVFIVTGILLSALFIDVGSAAEKTTRTVEANGRITQPEASPPQKTEFLIRYVWIGSLSSAEDVDAYVAAHPWGTGILLTDLSSGILSIVSYNGWNPNQTWQGSYGGISYAQLKSVIDEFHSFGWKVIYSPGNTPISKDNYIYDYLTLQHPELIAVSGDGRTYDQIHSGQVMVNFFANYTTPDTARNIAAGQRLSDLYYQRLSQMISDRSFEWDGWFGIDGWNGFTNLGMYWVWSTDQPFGRTIGTSDLSKWYYGDAQSVAEWASSSYAHGLPTNWNSYSLRERINWITANANLNWWQYWQMRYAQFYAQINHVFDNRPSNVKVGSIISQDLSSTWASNGINNPAGMENLTMFSQYDSFNHYYIDNERYDYALMGQYQAYVAGLVKSKIPDAHCIVGVEIGSEFPVAACRQQYLASAETYVWKDGVQYRAVDPNWVLVWAGSTATWTDDSNHAEDITSWVKTIAKTLDSDVSPAWLGPVAVQPLFLDQWSAGPFSVNFTFAQYTDALNLNNTGSNFVPEMGTVFFDAFRNGGNAIGGGAYQNLLNLYSSGSLNVILSTNSYGASFSNTLFLGQGDAECSSTFKITPQETRSASDATTLPSRQVTDPYARQIIGNTFGAKYSGYAFSGCMNSGTGLIPLVMYDNGPVQLGMYYNGTCGRFLYGNAWGNAGAIVNDRALLNRGIYWASKCPITASDSLADIKIFTLWNGDTAISIMNQRSLDGDLPLTLNLSGLGLDPSSSYKATWAMNGNSVGIIDLSSVSVTLTSGADVLIISAL